MDRLCKNLPEELGDGKQCEREPTLGERYQIN